MRKLIEKQAWVFSLTILVEISAQTRSLLTNNILQGSYCKTQFTVLINTNFLINGSVSSNSNL